MSDFKNLKDSVKGKIEEIKGDVNQKKGEGLKGGIQKLKGKAMLKKAEFDRKIKHTGARVNKNRERKGEM